MRQFLRKLFWHTVFIVFVLLVAFLLFRSKYHQVIRDLAKTQVTSALKIR